MIVYISKPYSTPESSKMYIRDIMEEEQWKKMDSMLITA